MNIPIQQFSNSARLGGLIAICAMTVTFATSAAAIEGDAQGIVEIDFSEPGVLHFDGSQNRSFLPLPSEPLSFESEEAYFEYIDQVLNFKDDDDGGRSLTIVTVGTFYTLSSDLLSFVPVGNPIATLIGGRYGIVNIAGLDVCVDALRCGLAAVNPITLNPYKMETFTCRSSTSSNNLKGDDEISISTSLCFKREPVRYNTLKEEIEWRGTTKATTAQLKGGYQLGFPSGAQPAPMLVCRGPLLKDGSANCHWETIEPLALRGEGHNHLYVDFVGFTDVLDARGDCTKDVRMFPHPQNAAKDDVPRVTLEHVSVGYETDPARTRLHSPLSLLSNHKGIVPVPDGSLLDLRRLNVLSTGLQTECWNP